MSAHEIHFIKNRTPQFSVKNSRSNTTKNVAAHHITSKTAHTYTPISRTILSIDDKTEHPPFPPTPHRAPTPPPKHPHIPPPRRSPEKGHLTMPLEHVPETGEKHVKWVRSGCFAGKIKREKGEAPALPYLFRLFLKSFRFLEVFSSCCGECAVLILWLMRWDFGMRGSVVK